MRPTEKIKKLFVNSNVTVTTEFDDKVKSDTFLAFEKIKKTKSAQFKLNIGRNILQSPFTKLTAAACVIAAIVIGINRFGIDSSGKVFAAAINSIKQARTFSCIESFEATRENGKKYVFEQTWMFKEPDRERHVCLSDVNDIFNGRITITHYGKRQQLDLNPFDKTATLYDKSSDYVVNSNTGMLELRHLDTSLRDRLLEMSGGAAEDTGNTELDGKIVRMFRTRGKERITTVWIDPRTALPVQIKIERPGEDRSPVMYKSIQIDGQLDDELFSLVPPEGYQLKKFADDWPINKKKISAKIMYLLLKCAEFNDKHNGQYPGTLADLEEVGVSDEVLKIILAAPEQPYGPAVIQFRQPRPNVDWTKEVVLYEKYDKWPDDGIVVGFADLHSEIVNQKYFEELMK
jgi:hypothetical protein